MDPIPSEVSQERIKEAEQLLSRSMDELYEGLGKELGERGFPEDLIRAGRTRFHAIVSRCRANICGSETIRVACTSRIAGRDAQLVCILADTIMHTMGVPVPAMAISTVLVLNGLETFCQTEWR
jgi:hypothetical protein